MRRARPAALAAAVGAAVLSACSSPPAFECPGTALALLGFASPPRLPAGDARLAGLDPVPDVPDCTGGVGAFPDPLAAFQATLAYDPASQVAAFCRVQGNAVLYGTLGGTRFHADARTDGAVLTACAATCTAILSTTVEGDVTEAPGGAVTAFDGALVEVLTPVAPADCGTCFATPPGACAARYLLHGS